MLTTGSLTLSTGEGTQDRLGHPARRRPQDQAVGRAVVARNAQEINEFILRGNTELLRVFKISFLYLELSEYNDHNLTNAKHRL